MRLRHIKGAEEYVASSGFVIKPAEDYKGRWKELSGGKSVFLEIGMGKGDFIRTLAQRNPSNFYLGMERVASILILAERKAEALQEAFPENLYFLCENARRLTEFFEDGELSGIYLNFSDPWPKKRHADRRLTSPFFLSLYRRILKEGSSIEFKTDNEGLFRYSLETLPKEGWLLEEICFDLPRDTKGNIETEYEEKFRNEGHPIYRLKARPLPL